MASKPSNTPRWANVGGAIVEPTSGKKDVGWAVGEKPPAQFENWKWNLDYQWAEYLKDGAFTGAFALASDISPSAISGTTHNWNPTDLATTQGIRVDMSADATVTGLAGGSAGRLIIIENVDSAFQLTLTDEDTNSTAGNRFSLRGASAILLPGQNIVLRYDATASRWKVIGGRFSRQRTYWISYPEWRAAATGVHLSSGTGTSSYTETSGTSPGDSVHLVAPIVLPPGTRIDSITGYLVNNSVLTNTVFLDRHELTTWGGGSSGVVGSVTDGGTSGNKTLAVASLPHTMAVNYGYIIRAFIHHSDEWYGAKLVTTEPVDT